VAKGFGRTLPDVLLFPATGPLSGSFQELTPHDREAICQEHWLTNEICDAAGLKRIPDFEGRRITGWSKRNCAGILIPFPTLDGSISSAFRIRRDNPDKRVNLKGETVIERKYAQPYGQRNHIYWAPGTTVEDIQNPALPIIITEGEYKTLALWRLANHDTSIPRFLPIGLGGVDAWMGRDGKQTLPGGDTADTSGIIPDMRRIVWEDRQVVIAYDADLQRKPTVKGSRKRLAVELRTAGAVVAYLEWDERNGKGVDDWLSEVGPATALSAYEAINWDCTTGWKALLDRPESGAPRAHVLNVLTAFRNASEWDGVIGYNDFTGEVTVCAPPPYSPLRHRPWRDSDDINTAAWMQANGLNVSPAVVAQAVMSHCETNRFHPIREYLRNLQWDGDGRIDTWLTDYLGVEPSEYVSQVGRRWLISAVARVMQPGCKADHMLLLEGEQGIGKSTVLKQLASEDWFTDQMPDIDTKDAQLQTIGAWIIEWGELDVMNRSETNAVKAFLSRTTERFRRPYGKNVEDFPRQCVFAGTSNKDEHFEDETGNRRFWPVRCTRADAVGIAAIRDQIWAEAFAMYTDGHHWWLESDAVITAAKEQQAARVRMDPWHGKIVEATAVMSETTSEELLEKMNVPMGQWTQAMRQRIGKTLRAIGFECRIVKRSGVPLRLYVRSR
jgi:predicted P-loop ATPase